MGSNRTIVWFRRDLRIEDNPALAAAAKEGSVFPVFIWCPKEEGQFYPGRVSRWWLKQSLSQLRQSLKSLGAELVLIKTQSTLAALLECITAVNATKVVFNHLYGTFSRDIRTFDDVDCDVLMYLVILRVCMCHIIFDPQKLVFL